MNNQVENRDGLSHYARCLYEVSAGHPYSWGPKHGFPNQTIKRIIDGAKPQDKTLDKLAHESGMPLAWWKGEGAPIVQMQAQNAAAEPRGDYATWAATIDVDEFVPVRYFRSAEVSAGHGAFNEDHAPDALLFSRTFLRTIDVSPDAVCLVKVRGDSMSPTLQAGWTVMIDQSRTVVSSGIYVIRLAEQVVCKRLEARPGVVKVMSDNRMYDDYEIRLDETPSGAFDVIGKVRWFAGVLD